MNIAWSQSMRAFIAEFSSDFQGDLSAIKAAGFRTFGPPAWVWYAPSSGIKTLNKLRENRPASGLTISEEALAIYKPLAEQEARKAELKKQFSVLEKKAKKERKDKEQEAATSALLNIPEGQIWIGPEDLPPKPLFISELPVPAPHKGPWCHVCGQPVYLYELQQPPTCLWCELHPSKIFA